VSISSMTGFARTEGTENGYSWSWEIRSVNARSLDARLRLPPGMDRLEARLKPEVTRKFQRGNISATLSLVRPPKQSSLSVNTDVLDQVLALANDIAGRVKANPPTIDGLLSVRGVLDTVEEEESSEGRVMLDDAIVLSFGSGLDSLGENREQEGQRLGDVVKGHIDEIATLASRADSAAAASPAAVDKRLREQVRALIKDEPSLPEERIAQEVALLVAKGDIREELDRLKAHVEAARELLQSNEPIGRPFDFLCQEFNREANTLCSKASDIELTRIGLDLKASIERLREQIQNIE
jgi:uncharacterized protein (TIGR00255 family)